MHSPLFPTRGVARSRSAPAIAERAAAAVPEITPTATPRRPLHLAVTLAGTDLGRSGIGTYVREVLPHLIARARADGGALTALGHRRDLAAYADELVGATLRPISMLPSAAGPNALCHLALAGLASRRAGADVLVLPAANRRLVLWSPIPTVAVVHDLAQLRVPEKYDRLRMAYFRRILIPAFRRPTQLVAVSSATRDDLVRALKIERRRVRVVYNGVNAARFRTLAPDSEPVAAARRESGLGDRPYLFYPARLEHPGKNHLRLIRAFASSEVRHTHTLVLSGADWGAGELIRTAIRTANLADRVLLLGFIPADHLAALIAGADAVLMLGLHEGFGLPPLEALSAGRPVCVANTGALPEVVGNLGVQCDPYSESSIAQALQIVVSDYRIRSRCEINGPVWAAGFTWSRTAAGLLAACHTAAS